MFAMVILVCECNIVIDIEIVYTSASRVLLHVSWKFVLNYVYNFPRK